LFLNSRKKLGIFIVGGFSLLAGLVLVLTAVVGKNDLRAAGEPSTHTHYVTLDPNGGTGGLAGYHQVCGSNVRGGVWSPPTRAGYVFIGYYYDCGCQALNAGGSILKNACYCYGSGTGWDGEWLDCKDLTLYAHWRLPNSSDHTVAQPPQSGTGWILLP